MMVYYDLYFMSRLGTVDSRLKYNIRVRSSVDMVQMGPKTVLVKRSVFDHIRIHQLVQWTEYSTYIQVLKGNSL